MWWDRATCPTAWKHHFSANGPTSHASLTWTQIKSLGPRSELTFGHTLLTWIPLLHGAVQLSGDTNNRYKDLLTWRSSEACCSCVAYSWTGRSARFADPVILLDHPHVLNVTTPLYQCELSWTMTLHGYPNNQAARSKQLWEIHNVQIMRLWRSKAFAPHDDNSGGYKYPSISIKKEVSFWVLLRTPFIKYFLLFFKQGYLYSHLRVFGRHHTGAPDLTGVLFLRSWPS